MNPWSVLPPEPLLPIDWSKLPPPPPPNAPPHLQCFPPPIVTQAPSPHQPPTFAPMVASSTPYAPSYASSTSSWGPPKPPAYQQPAVYCLPVNNFFQGWIPSDRFQGSKHCRWIQVVIKGVKWNRSLEVGALSVYEKLKNGL